MFWLVQLSKRYVEQMVEKRPINVRIAIERTRIDVAIDSAIDKSDFELWLTDSITPLNDDAIQFVLSFCDHWWLEKRIQQVHAPHWIEMKF